MDALQNTLIGGQKFVDARNVLLDNSTLVLDSIASHFFVQEFLLYSHA